MLALEDFKISTKKSNKNGQGEEKLSPVLFRKITAVHRGDCVWDTQARQPITH
jgi:hypothetical protein